MAMILFMMLSVLAAFRLSPGVAPLPTWLPQWRRKLRQARAAPATPQRLPTHILAVPCRLRACLDGNAFFKSIEDDFNSLLTENPSRLQANYYAKHEKRRKRIPQEVKHGDRHSCNSFISQSRIRQQGAGENGRSVAGG